MALYAESPESASPPRLVGIVTLADRPCAVLEFAGLRHRPAGWWIASEGEAYEDIRVTKIAPDKNRVELVWQWTNSTTVRLNNATNLLVPGIVLEDASINAVLSLFAQFTNRTLLRWPSLPATSFSLCASAKDRADAARVLAQALVARELSIIPDGEKFLMIVPNSKAAVVKPHAPATKAPMGSGSKAQATTPGPSDGQPEAIPAGLIDFRSAEISQVADIYAMMLGRKLDHSERTPAGGTISLTSRTSITMGDAIYALETLLRWSGVKLVPVGENGLKAVPAQEN
jgi:hypothetical protein